MPWRILLLCCLCDASLAVEATDWPHWRGPQRNGLTQTSSQYQEGDWIENTPAWTATVGEGGTSPLVVDNTVFTMGWQGDQDTVFAIDATSAKVQWQQSYACPRHGRHATGDQGLYSGPTATPEYDPQTDFLYTLSCDGDLRCWNTKQQGKLVWELNLYDKYQVPRRPKIGRRGHRDYGYTSAPMVFGDWLLVEVGAKTGNLIAFDKRSGTELWTSECKDPAGHTGGFSPMEVEGIPCVAWLTVRNLIVARLDQPHAGETVAQYRWETDFSNSIAAPAVEKNRVFITSDYNQHAICCVDIAPGRAELVWKKEFSSKICTPVVHQGYLYWTWRQAHCLQTKDGKEIWSSPPRFGDAGSCIVTGDEKLIVWAKRGELVLAQTAGGSSNEYQELAARSGLFQTDVWPHVALANGSVYLKDRKGNVACYRIANRK